MDFEKAMEFLRNNLSLSLLEIGTTPITIWSFVKFFVVLGIFWLISMLIRRLLLDKAIQYAEVDEKKAASYHRALQGILIAIGVLLGINAMGFDFNKFYGLLKFEIYQVNQTSITVMSLLILVALISSFGLISKIVQRFFARQVFSYMDMDLGTQYTFSRMIHYLVMLIGGIIAFQQIGISLSGLAVIFGFLSVGIGFGLQNITSNFVAGLMLLFERPIKVGDRVRVGEVLGDVEEIKIRSTTIRSENNISIIVPNSEFVSSTVVNLSHHDSRVLMDVDVGVSYSSNLDTVIKALKEVAAEHSSVLKSPEPEVHLMGFGDSSWDMQLRTWINTPKANRRIRSELNCAIVEKFHHYNIEIPFPQRDLHVRSSIPVPLDQHKADDNGHAETG